ncbi:restriction endonuclease PLD domain-containing protein [Rummeliibacillus sp. TYF-LIM-RU47]|uniref:restriction endonuclease PLD domain-containing protein n=1 Tax=Rummeliibacillus sp. TYF-LIM-RU47 TaxID=2608406 RepID=UPI00123BAD20|nr:restriction endonuclease PLD domain-containing protein [Rummeliibacillus sp. TYF-LIM-RU47]
MYLIQDLEVSVIENPYNMGYRHLRVLSGYVSPIYVEHILETYSELILDIVVGMVSHDGIAVWHHRGFLNLMEQFQGRLTISYQISRPGNHRKVYYWLQNEELDAKVFVGSANFTQNGFIRQNELLVEANYANIDDVFADLNVLSCDNPTIDSEVNFYEATPRRVGITTSIESTNELEEIEVLSTPTHSYSDYVDISLVAKNGEVPARSGLNWGQREGRNRNQAYLSVPKTIHDEKPDFFPPLKETFLVITDDGENLICVMAQQNRKGIHTREDNSLMGMYFRRRLGLESESFVETDDLRRYGRDSVRIYKIDDETYYLDFSV